MANKMTKKDYFAILKAMVEQANPDNMKDMVAFIDHEVELLEKKSAKSGATKTQKENVGIMEVIKEVLSEQEKPVTVTTLMADERLSAYSNQKLSALLKKLVDAFEVVKTVDKKKSYFSLAT